MKQLIDVIESIMDDDATAIKSVSSNVSHQIIELLISNGIYYANKTNTREKTIQSGEIEIASYINDHLSFFSDSGLASVIIIDYNKVENFLKQLKLKSIEAPKITIIDPPDDMSVFGTLYTNELVIRTNYYCRSLTNIKVKKCSDWKGTVLFNVRNDNFGSFYETATFPKRLHDTIYINNGGEYTLQNCDLNCENLYLHGDNITFTNLTGNITNIEFYDPGLFDHKYGFGEEIFTLFDANYSYRHEQTNRDTVLRKTNRIIKLLSYFGNKNYSLPDSSPFKVIGKLGDILNITKIKNLESVKFRNNKYTLLFTKNINLAKQCQDIDKFKYMSNDFKKYPLEQTTDGFYTVIYESKI